MRCKDFTASIINFLGMMIGMMTGMSINISMTDPKRSLTEQINTNAGSAALYLHRLFEALGSFMEDADGDEKDSMAPSR